MNEILLMDLYRYEGEMCHSLKIRLKYILLIPGFSFIYFFRKASLSKTLINRAFWTICHRLCMYRTTIQIPIGTKIGEGFRIVHFGNIVINPGAVIGKNFTIAQGVLIGNSQGKHMGVPIIGNNVQLCANSIIIGNVHIGNDVLVAPGAFVNFDVPDNCIVIGNPGKIINRDSSPTRKYIVYSVDDFQENK